MLWTSESIPDKYDNNLTISVDVDTNNENRISASWVAHHSASGRINHPGDNNRNITLRFPGIGGKVLVGSLTPSGNIIEWENGLRWFRRSHKQTPHPVGLVNDYESYYQNQGQFQNKALDFIGDWETDPMYPLHYPDASKSIHLDEINISL